MLHTFGKKETDCYYHEGCEYADYSKVILKDVIGVGEKFTNGFFSTYEQINGDAN
jgi:hypothetical protein